MADVIRACANKEKPYSFISYSHADAEVVYPILEQLCGNGYRIWFDQHIEGGTKWAENIHEWLTNENCVKFIILISRNSVESEYVEDEVNLARKYKKSCLVIYLEEISLSGTLELLLDRWQSISWYEKPDDTFLRMLMKGIPTDTIEICDTIYTVGDFALKYQLLEVIGKGGTSTVYKAKMLATDAIVTVKIANGTPTTKDIINQVLKNEKDALAKLQCPFIPSIIDFGETYFDGENMFYLVESFVSGKSLAEIRCPLNEAEVVMIILSVAKILRYLHTDGIDLVHTDIKPGNIIIDQYN